MGESLRKMSAGDQGSQVLVLRERLKRLGHFRGPDVDMAESTMANRSRFDGALVSALYSYQAFHGLEETGVLDEATITHLEQPRCGLPDLPTSDEIGEYTVEGSKWGSNRLRYRFKGGSTKIDQASVESAIDAALELWSQVTPLRFSKVTTDAEIVISFATGDHGDNYPFDDIGPVLAHAFYPRVGGSLAGDVHFDDAHDWQVDGSGGIDLVTVAAHEIGHALGLKHSAVKKALMYPTYSGPHRHLHDDDVAGIQSLYGGQSS